MNLEGRGIRGLYAVTAPPLSGTLEETVERVLLGGARVVQYRDKGDDAARRTREAAALGALCRRHDAVFLINDDVELARRVGADGVHLGRGDASPAAAREVLGASAIIGASCYADPDLARRASAGGADYLAFGSVFPSSTKPDAVRAPLELFRSQRIHGLPLVGIGGVDAEGAEALARAGADAVAVVHALFGASDPEAAARRITERFLAGAAASGPPAPASREKT